jgi:hypothetical protein
VLRTVLLIVAHTPCDRIVRIEQGAELENKRVDHALKLAM